MRRENNPTGRLRSIQALRAIAALLVVVFHAISNIQRHGWLATGVNWIGTHGEFGVDIFFVVSGFVMTSATQNSPQSFASSGRFILSRLKRIVPLYWIATTVFVVLLLVAPHLFGAATFELPHVLASYMFVPWRNPAGEVAPVLNVGWTLNYEMWFYAAYAVAICTTRRRVTAITIFFCVTSGLSALGISNVAFQTYTSPIVLEFVFGAIVGSLYVRGFRFPLIGAIVLLSAACCMLIALDKVTGESHRFVVFGIPAALLVSGAVGLETRVRWSRAAQSIGDASYSLYLSHVFTVPIAVKLMTKFDVHHRLSGNLVCAASTVFSVCVALACYRWLERPLVRAVETRLNRRSSSGMGPLRNI